LRPTHNRALIMTYSNSDKRNALIALTIYKGTTVALENLNSWAWKYINSVNHLTRSAWAHDNEILMRRTNQERYARLKDRLQKKADALIKLSSEIEERQEKARQQYLKEIGRI